MNICTSFCLLPSAIRRMGRNLWVDGPLGPVEIQSLKKSLCHYRGSKLRNGSIRLYLQHVLRELQRILRIPCGWTLDKSKSKITNQALFYESMFLPGARERDLLERWRCEEEDRK